MSQSLTEEIVIRVADAKGVDPTELEYSLQEYIDMDALNQLADHSKTPWTLSFELPEYQVTVMSDGSIVVSPVEIERTAHAPRE